MTLDELEDKYPGAQTFTFGDSRPLCNLLLKLVREGRKTATSTALREYDDNPAGMPTVGRRDICLDWDGNPMLVIETTEVSVLRFDAVGVDFALAEGENTSLDAWQESHRRYFARNGGFSPEMLLVCERFRVVEDLGTEPAAAPPDC